VRRGFQFLEAAIDHRSERRILLAIESSRAFELGRSLHDPRIGGPPAVKCLRLTVDDRSGFLDADLSPNGRLMRRTAG
jgi:hypothetical protein